MTACPVRQGRGAANRGSADMCRRDEAYIVSHFREALAQGHIRAYFQPVFASIAGMIISAEALARWHDPDGGTLSPADFIPALEKHGLIYDLDMEILRQTCAFYRELSDRGTPVPCFSVNLSRLDFRRGGDERLFDRVLDTLSRYDVPRQAIKLEITESLMLEDIDTFQKLFRQFRDAGFTLWIDDFGSGYSSLNVLQSYSFDVIKFDMQFLHNFTPKGRQLLASLIRMAKSLGMHTLTEGVETEEQQDFLVSVGCELQQGFYYSRPLSRADFVAFIDAKRDLLGTEEDKAYWKQIGRLNFLSANPLDDYARMEQAERGEAPAADASANAGASIDSAGVPLALLECSRNKALYVYVNNNYRRHIQELGYPSIDALEHAFNDHRSDQYLMIKKLVTDTISLGTRQTVEYVNNDVYYRLSAKCLAKKKDKAMLALRLTTFDSEREIQTAKEMLNYGNSLFSTYELVVVMYPDSGISKRIYTANSLPSYDQAGSLSESFRGFCESEVMPVDQARYLRFMDYETITQRVEASPKGFIQSSFRLHWGSRNDGARADSDVGPWYTARVSRIPASAERAYLLTIQSHPANEARHLDVIARDHPEILE